MLPPRRSSPARMTFPAAPIPASPQPSDLAASAARRPSPAALSCASASLSPLFPLPALPDQVPEPLVLRDLPPGLVQPRPGPQVHRPRPPFHRPCQVPLRPVTRVLRGGARAVRLAALAAHLVQRPPAEVPDPRQLPVQLLPPALEFRQLIRLFRHCASWSECLTTLRLGQQPATTQNPYKIDVHPVERVGPRTRSILLLAGVSSARGVSYLS